MLEPRCSSCSPSFVTFQMFTETMNPQNILICTTGCITFGALAHCLETCTQQYGHVYIFYISLPIFKHTVKLLRNFTHCNSICNLVNCCAFHLLIKPLYLCSTMKYVIHFTCPAPCSVVFVGSNRLSVMTLVYMHHKISLTLPHVNTIERAHHFT